MKFTPVDEEVSKPQSRFNLKSEQPHDSYSYGDAAVDTGKSILNSLANVGEPITHPLETVTGVAKGIRQILTTNPVDTAKGIVQNLTSTDNPDKVPNWAYGIHTDPLSFAGGVVGAGAAVKSIPALAQSTGKISKNILSKVTAPKLNPIDVIDKTVKNVRSELLKEDGYVQKEHNLYSEAVDKIKSTPSTIKDAPQFLDDFASKNRDEFGNFKTPEIKKVYDKLTETLSSGGNISEARLYDAIKELKGNFKSTVDSNKSLNLSAVKDLTSGFQGENANILKAANARYSQFKPVERDINEMIGLYGNKLSSKSTDSAIQNLLKTDFSKNPNQLNILDKIGRETGVDIKNTARYYGGKYKLSEAMKPNIFGVNLKNLLKGGSDVMKGKPTSTGKPSDILAFDSKGGRLIPSASKARWKEIVAEAKKYKENKK